MLCRKWDRSGIRGRCIQILEMKSRAAVAAICVTCSLWGANRLQAEPTLSSNGDHFMVIGCEGFSEYIEEYNSLVELGYRPTWINCEYFEPSETLDGGPPVQAPYINVSAIFRHNPLDLQFGHEFGLSESMMKDRVELNQEIGFEMMQIEAYEVDGTTYYTYISHETSVAPMQWDAMIGMSSEVHATGLGTAPFNTMNIVNQCETEDGGQTVITSLHKNDFTETHVPSGWLTNNDLYFLRLDLEQEGFRLTSLEVINSSGYLPWYLPVFKRNGELAFTYTDQVSGDFPSEVKDFNEDEAAGMTPVLISAQDMTASDGPGWGAIPFHLAAWRGRAKVRQELRPKGSGGDDFTIETRDPYQSVPPAANDVLAGEASTLQIQQR
jgi:hypothetical protein